jgi:hypothetical protein
MLRLMSATALMLVLAASGAGAQAQPGGAPAGDSLALAIGRTSAGARIRFVMHGGKRTLGDDPRVQNDSVLVKINGRVLAFQLVQIDTLWVKTGRSAGRGAMIVGIPAALVGALLGTSFACGIEATPSCHNASNTFRGAALIAAILGAPAAVAGALIGSTIIRWKRIYVRPA